MFLVPSAAISLSVLLIPLLDISTLDASLDFVIVAVYLFYGGLMIWVAVAYETEWMDQIPFHGLISANRTFLVAGVTIALSSLVDLAVYYDLAYRGGSISPQIVSLSNMVMLVALGISVLWMSGSSLLKAEEEPPPLASTEDDRAFDGMTQEEYIAHQEKIIMQLDQHMLNDKLYRDEDLSLNRFARKTLIPSRQISTAINNQRAMNVPQYVNTFRVIEACERLKVTDAPVTEIIYDVGFTTKSNFNREFQRVVGLSPSAYRRSGQFGSRLQDWPFIEILWLRPRHLGMARTSTMQT